MIGASNIRFNYRNNGFGLNIHKLSIEPGEKVALTGPSGTGKTTLLNLLAGILVPSSGAIEIDGLDIAGLPAEDRQDFRAVKMGLIFQEFGLLEYLTVLENICLPYRISPVLELDAAVPERASEIAEAIGLRDKLRRYPKHLSQGERQRIEICRALITQPAASAVQMLVPLQVINTTARHGYISGCIHVLILLISIPKTFSFFIVVFQ